MKIATAQIEVKIGDLSNNLKKHFNLINLAIENKVDLIVFPEMSLTGYCREERKRLIVKEESLEIIKLKQKAKQNNIVIIIGAPIQIEDEIYIGSFILKPNGDVEIYTKQFLHSGEDEYYSSSLEYNPKLELKGETICFAICADIDNEQHPSNAKENNCSLYLPSIFFSKNGIDKGHKVLSNYAKTYSMKILMSNFSGRIWGMDSGGRSGFWDENGNLIAELDDENEGLLIIEKKEKKWSFRKFVGKENELDIEKQ